jgi:predicted RNase H-like nuclease
VQPDQTDEGETVATDAALSLRLLGVDGCRAGWVVAERDRSGVALQFQIVPTFAALLALVEGARAIIAVDIPIGLPSGVPAEGVRADVGLTPAPPPAAANRGRRRADAAARIFLGPRRAASVFSAPCRPTLAATTYREACALESAARGSGVGLSQQAYNIIPKIREVDALVRPAHQRPVDAGAGVWVREVHPEVTFALLAGYRAMQPAGRSGDVEAGYGLAHSKRRCAGCPPGTCSGEAERLALLLDHLPAFDPAAVRHDLIARERAARALPHDDQPQRKPGAPVGRDDIVDAVACLVTAQRIADGTARTFPADDAGGPELDARGLRMEIVA